MARVVMLAATALLRVALAAATQPSALELIEHFGLRVPVATRATSWRPSSASCTGFAVAGDDGGAGGVASVAAIDGLVDEPLRRALLAAMGEDDERFEAGPSPEAWTTGLLTDHDDDVESGAVEGAPSLGLRPRVLAGLRDAGAVVELESRLRAWLVHANGGDEGLVLSRVPFQALGGAGVPTLVGNAPVHGDGVAYAWHVDGDPSASPPSPWRDAFGDYPNRSPGAPRWVTALVYVGREWRDDWAAPTRFLDPAGPRVLDVAPAPGRVVLFDADLGHSVTAPAAAAGKRARFSLALKLVVHPGGGDRAELGVFDDDGETRGSFRALRRDDFPP